MTRKVWPSKGGEGRPRRRWTDRTREGLAEKGLREGDAGDRGRWRRSSKMATLLQLGNVKDRRAKSVLNIYQIGYKVSSH